MSDPNETEPHAPIYEEGATVFTIEGIAGTITSPGEWDHDAEEYTYFVEWEDGSADTQPESFFADDVERSDA